MSLLKEEGVIIGRVRSLRHRREYGGYVCSLRYYDEEGFECFKRFRSSGVIEAKSGDEFEFLEKSVGNHDELRVVFNNKTVGLKYDFVIGEGFLFYFVLRVVLLLILYIVCSLVFSYVFNPSLVDYAKMKGVDMRSVETLESDKNLVKCVYDIENDYNPFSFVVFKGSDIEFCSEKYGKK